MLKTHRDNRTWLVSQPDHGRVAGYLAAHWGNDQFAAPGHFADAHDPEQLCAETVLAIAEHDNGWWEWEAIPELGDRDDLPLDLAEVLKNRQEGMDRWRRGIPRFGALRAVETRRQRNHVPPVQDDSGRGVGVFDSRIPICIDFCHRHFRPSGWHRRHDARFGH